MPDAILLPAVAAEEEEVRAEVSAARTRACEWVVLVFLVYSIGLALILPVAPAVRNRLALVNCAVILAYGIFIRRL